MSDQPVSLVIQFVTSVAALALSVVLGGLIINGVAGLGAPSWLVWTAAIAYFAILMAAYFGLKRTKFGKYLWTLPDGITW